MLKKILICSVLMSGFQAAQAVEYTLSVQPYMKPDKQMEFFKPLVDYLKAATGESIKLKTHRSFKAYWYHMKRNKDFDLVLDGAHFIDYRVKNFGHQVLAKLPDTVSFTIATRSDIFLFEAEELIPLKVAAMIPPGISGIRLKELFPDPANRPTIVRSYDAEDAVRHLKEGRADAVIIPTPMVRNYPELNTLMTTTPIPHQGFTASPSVPDSVVQKIKTALLNAHKTEEGKKALASVNIVRFVPATNDTYNGYAELLDVLKKP